MTKQEPTAPVLYYTNGSQNRVPLMTFSVTDSAVSSAHSAMAAKSLGCVVLTNSGNGGTVGTIKKKYPIDYHLDINYLSN